MATSFLALISPIKRTILRNREYQADATGARRKGGNVERTYSIEGNHRFHKREGKKKEKGKKSKNQIRDWMALHLFQFSHGSQVPTNSPGEREREGERTALIESKQHGASTMRTRATI